MNPPNFTPGVAAAPTLPPRKNPLAIWSLVLGLPSFLLVFVCIGWLTAPLAIIFGILALIQIKGGPSHIMGKSLALTG